MIFFNLLNVVGVVGKRSKIQNVCGFYTYVLTKSENHLPRQLVSTTGSPEPLDRVLVSYKIQDPSSVGIVHT